MKLGFVSDSRYHVSDLGKTWSLHSFIISTDVLSFSRLFHSAFATPARYLQEMFLRLGTLEADGGGEPKFIFNPLFSSSALDILQVLAALKDAMPFDGVTILSDKNNLPAGYLFPSRLSAEDARFFTLLSTVDAKVDATLCGLLFECEVRILTAARLTLARSQHNGFTYQENRETYRWVAERAIAVLQSKPLRGTIPFTAVMPHHAGDVLFFTVAFNWIRPLVRRIATNRAYRDIVDDNAPTLAVFPIETPPTNRTADFRQGKVTPESVYFHSIKDKLPEDSFYTYCRPSRDYNLTLFHLIDHFAFALGRSFQSNQDLFVHNAQRPQLFHPGTSADSAPRILLHFDGGWPLKVYPKSLQLQLIELLRAAGCTVTVLAGDDRDYPNCAVTTFENYAQFKKLLKTQNLMVGMDSFPSHYATHVLGLPTICLFASTRPENSDAPAAPNYVRLEEGLRCRPCYGINRCPRYGGTECRNFVAPAAVFSAIVKMLRDVHLENGGHAPAIAPQQSSPTVAREASRVVQRISLRHLRLKVALSYAVAPVVRYLSLLYREYAAIVRRDGFLLANQHALRFLRKKLRQDT